MNTEQETLSTSKNPLSNEPCKKFVIQTEEEVKFDIKGSILFEIKGLQVICEEGEICDPEGCTTCLLDHILKEINVAYPDLKFKESDLTIKRLSSGSDKNE